MRYVTDQTLWQSGARCAVHAVAAALGAERGLSLRASRCMFIMYKYEYVICIQYVHVFSVCVGVCVCVTPVAKVIF